MKKSIILVLFLACFQRIQAQNFPIDSIYGDGIIVKRVDSPILNEISGMVFGKLNPNLIYVHNDSGGEPKVYLLDSLGNELGEIELLGAMNRDWEDIAIGPGKNGQSSIYVGDIGDNSAVYESITIYRFPEPSDKVESLKVNPEKIVLRYPDGPMDAETLMVDPISGDIFILSKRDKQNTLFRLPAEKFSDGEGVLEEVIKMPFTSSVAGDISQDGTQIVIKNYFDVYYWQRNGSESISNTLAKSPVRLPYEPEPQGEAIAFNPKGQAFYTISEARFAIIPKLYRYPKK
jgi:hypothetical protein